VRSLPGLHWKRTMRFCNCRLQLICRVAVLVSLCASSLNRTRLRGSVRCALGAYNLALVLSLARRSLVGTRPVSHENFTSGPHCGVCDH
jgi:hypothetical protein